MTTSEDWLHISTDQNPADILSRGCGPKQLQKCTWWQGPAWLQNPKEQWPKSAVNIDEKEVEIEKRKSVISANNTELESISLQLARRFSRYSKMIRVMAWVLRFQPKAKDLRKYTELTNEELLNAQKIIFRVVQKECYSNEETRKHLRGLQVFEDEEGILRLKSRLINEEESKYFISPIILPSKHLASTKIKSEARELVESFPITNENYPLAIESLTERYGRKDLLIDFYVRELLKLVLNNATKKKQDSLSSLYIKLSTQLRALSSLGVTTDQCGVILYPLIESSLTTHILRSFERQRKNIDSEQSISSLDAIVSFLKSEVQSEEKIKFSRSEILASENRKHLVESQRSLSPSAELFIQ
ncbi:uncharacterized protein NPIL_198371 [Nephila pilipes]|uniref:Uncharacterized protein n=3 Tax=Nephila pilipes TaxID=299642 RepID=A0A8X6Q362_NEPPI|nr:uncharacterized protein NPIL_129811 [Nephila pilipes]GFU03322.1 uncharacterized protein NPIL_198371 [Nephila pilipes]